MVDKNGREHKPKGDGGGQFVSKSSGDTPAETIRANEIVGTVTNNNSTQGVATKKTPKSQAEFWGKEFKGVKGQQAVELLLREKQGHVKGAFYVPEFPSKSDDGNVDLVWGDSGGGLQHLIERRDIYKASGKGTVSGLEMANKISDIITKGTFGIDEQDRPYKEYDGFRVSFKPNYDDIKVNWIVSAMEII